jgi:hypothetical protein
MASAGITAMTNIWPGQPARGRHVLPPAFLAAQAVAIFCNSRVSSPVTALPMIMRWISDGLAGLPTAEIGPADQ